VSELFRESRYEECIKIFPNLRCICETPAQFEDRKVEPVSQMETMHEEYDYND
jgi:hypothetical protein